MALNNERANKATIGTVRSLETEGSEGLAREAGRPGRPSEPVFMHPYQGAEEPGPSRRQSVRSSDEGPVMGLEPRERKKVETVSNRQQEDQPASVPLAKQAGEIRVRWAWTEPAVWTDRMLAALEDGVKGDVWFSLMDKVYKLANLRAAFAEVKANRGGAGVDHQSIEQYEEHLEANLQDLHERLKDGSYRPSAIKRVWIPKPGGREKRPLGIPTVRDRVAQAAVRHVLEPIFEKDFAEGSYGFRPKRGCKDALRRVDQLLADGYTWVVDADLSKYFDSIPHQRLLERIRTRVADGKVLTLIGTYLKQAILETAAEWTPEEGSPQGAVLSPLLSNLYLDPLDHEMARRGYAMVRYADDFVICCRSQSQAQAALAVVQAWVEAAGLRLHPVKTRLVDASAPGGFDFLGYHFERGRHWPSRKSLSKFRDAVRPQTRRTAGRSLEQIIGTLNRFLRGWFGYFKHSPRGGLRNLDSWVRMRLRSLLRRRSGRRGRANPADNVRWPNTFFAQQGLFSLAQAHAAACQSCEGKTTNWRAVCGRSARTVRRGEGSGI